MCSRAERKRRRRAAHPRVVETPSAWIVHVPSKGGTSARLRAEVDRLRAAPLASTRIAPALDLPLELRPKIEGLAAATGLSTFEPEHRERCARTLAFYENGTR